MTRRFLISFLAYPVLVFPLAYLWHLNLFADLYERLGVFGRPEPIVPLGFATIVVQGALLAWAYPRFRGSGGWVAEGLRFAAFAGGFLWTAQVLAMAAKHPIEPIGTYVAVETVYLAIQFALVGLVLGFVHRSVPASLPHSLAASASRS